MTSQFADEFGAHLCSWCRVTQWFFSLCLLHFEPEHTLRKDWAASLRLLSALFISTQHLFHGQLKYFYCACFHVKETHLL